MPTAARSARLPAYLSAAMLVAGSLLFLAGGSQHPQAGSAFGVVGTEAFFRAFAAEVHHHPHWVAIHVLILVGPLLWALGVPRAVGFAPSGSAAAALGELAGRALLLGAALWAVAFVLDGFVAPQTAGAIAAAAPADVPGLLVTFRVHQVTMVRLGLISWILVGAAMALYGAVLLVGARAASWRALVGVTGVLLGLWPLVATVIGEFEPGPFTSDLWNLTALLSAFWFAGFGITLMLRGPNPSTAPAERRARALAPEV